MGELRAKTCKRCGETKPLGEFYLSHKKYSVYQPYCKICCVQRSADYYQAHRDEIREKRRKYNKTTRRRGVHTSRRALNTPLQRLENKCRLVLRRGFINRGRYRGLVLQLLTGLPPEEYYKYLLETWERRYKVPYKGEPCHIDHIIPTIIATDSASLLKLFHYTNLQLLTPSDNLAKGCSIQPEQPH